MTINATATFTPSPNFSRYVESVIVPDLVQGVDEASERIFTEALALVPYKTGELHDSGALIPATDQGGQVVGGFEFTSDHAVYVEYGTGRRGASSPGAGEGPYDPNWPGMAAQPYVRPAMDNNHDLVVETVGGSVKLG